MDMDPTTGSVTPDEFSFAILKGDGTEAPTTGPSGALLIVDFDNALPGAVTTRAFQILPAQAVPEPGVLALAFGCALSCSAVALKRHGRRS